MSLQFPAFLDLKQNNCVIVGGGHYATEAARLLLPFGAQVTVISPTLTEVLTQLSAEGRIRHIPRRYFRGDCANAYLAIAATDQEAVNIAVASECKSRRILVNVSSPPEYGTFSLPQLAAFDRTIVAVHEESGGEKEKRTIQEIRKWLPLFLEGLEKSEFTKSE